MRSCASCRPSPGRARSSSSTTSTWSTTRPTSGTSRASCCARARTPDARVREPSAAGRPAVATAGGRRGRGARHGCAALRCRRDRPAVQPDVRPEPRADVLVDLARRTEGWIASLQLVHAALRDRSPADIRRFVQTLNGADHEMYDYLAEEVVGDLPDELQRFLMDTSILQVVTPSLAEVVSGRDAADVARLTAAAERLTLLSRLSGGPRTHQRYHPLVREFLEARFRSHDGARRSPSSIDARRSPSPTPTGGSPRTTIARPATPPTCCRRSAERIPTIMGNGQYGLAETFIGPVPAESARPASSSSSAASRCSRATTTPRSRPRRPSSTPPTDPVQRDYALLNLVTLNINCRRRGARPSGSPEALTVVSTTRRLREIARAASAWSSARTAALERINRRLRQMAPRANGPTALILSP